MVQVWVAILVYFAKDDNNKAVREKRRQQNIDCGTVADYAAEKGLEFISWEPMSISREQGETISECRRLQKDVNNCAPLPFRSAWM